MDSVSQKQNFLSLTGIDQLSENTDNIELGAVVLRQQAARLTAVEGQLDTINTNDIPHYVSTKATTQTIEGTKSFANLVAANLTVTNPITSTGLNCIYNSFSKNYTDIFLQSGDALAKENKLKYNPRTGVTIDGSLTVDETKVILKNGSTLNEFKNTSLNTGVLNATNVNALVTVTAPNIQATDFSVSKSATIAELAVTTTMSASKVTTNDLSVTNALAKLTVNELSSQQFFTDSLQIKGNPIYNISIPFEPSVQEGIGTTLTTASPISFYGFAGLRTSAVATNNKMERYLYPVDFFITHITAMFDGDVITGTQTHTIVLQSYSADGSTLVNGSLGSALFSVSTATRCGRAQLSTPIKILKTNALGGTHKFSLASGVKECFYVIHGYQA